MSAEKPGLKIISNPNNDIESSNFNVNVLANIVATKANTIIMNTTVKEMNNKIDVLNNNIAELINEFKKQSVDERNSSFKVARRDKSDAIPISSIDSHITHIISLIHIAEIYRLRTQKGDKFSAPKARKLLIDLNLLNDPKYVSKSIQGSVSVFRKYHFDILFEIKHRLQNPTSYNVEPSKCFEWREISFIPEDKEIQAYIDNLSVLLEVEDGLFTQI